MLRLIFAVLLLRLRLTLRNTCAGIAEWWRISFGTDRSEGWTLEALREISGEHPIVGRHRLGVAPGAAAQRARWTQDTQTMRAVI